jgi:hypothetical protein
MWWPQLVIVLVIHRWNNFPLLAAAFDRVKNIPAPSATERQLLVYVAACLGRWKDYAAHSAELQRGGYLPSAGPALKHFKLPDSVRSFKQLNDSNSGVLANAVSSEGQDASKLEYLDHSIVSWRYRWNAASSSVATPPPPQVSGMFEKMQNTYAPTEVADKYMQFTFEDASSGRQLGLPFMVQGGRVLLNSPALLAPLLNSSMPKATWFEGVASYATADQLPKHPLLLPRSTTPASAAASTSKPLSLTLTNTWTLQFPSNRQQLLTIQEQVFLTRFEPPSGMFAGVDDKHGQMHWQGWIVVTAWENEKKLMHVSLETIISTKAKARAEE